MDDLISRETMKDLIDITTWYHQNRNKDMVAGASDEETAWFKAEDVYKAIENVPSAQPDVLACGTGELNVPDTNVGDMINRQDVLALAKDVILINGAKHRCIDATQIHELPSAQPGRCEGCGNFNKTRLLISQPERKKGKWIDVNGNGSLYECDQCHDRSCCAGKYCMECGAQMEVGE